MTRNTHVPIFKRRRTGQTDYSKRKSMITSRSTILSIRISNKHSIFQFIEPKIIGDSIRSSSHSKQIIKLGWTGSGKSLHGLYLTGYLAGKKAKSTGLDKAILYIGRREFHSGSKIIYALKGVIDAGIEIPVNNEIFPDDEKFKTDNTEKIITEINSKYG
jgi:large subunit ribosomal protein L18|tara:strand:- start:126 stop:605 length:480 start_codon:yes stop_codon:yes gene_type:complete